MASAIRRVCAQFVQLCRQLGLLAAASVAIDGGFQVQGGQQPGPELHSRQRCSGAWLQIEDSVARYLHQLDTADRQEPSEALAAKTERLKEKIGRLKQEMARLEGLKARMLATPDKQISLTDPDARSMATSGRGSGVVGYNVQASVEIDHHLIVAMM